MSRDSLRDHVSGQDPGLVIHINDGMDVVVLTKSQIGSLNGANHHGCGGAMDISYVGKYIAIHCRVCGLRVTFPAYCKTTEQIKSFFEKTENYEKPNRFNILDLRKEK